MIIPGNSKSLWTSVNKPKDVGVPDILNNMFLGDSPVSGDKIADYFADFIDFIDEKVQKLDFIKF